MEQFGVPTASYKSFELSQTADIESYLNAYPSYPVVLKADGLAAGKGVFICETRESALDALAQFGAGSFGEAAGTLVIEEFMTGEEVSVFAACDGDHTVILAHAQDHKRIGDGDTGLNTGGMGAYSPAPVLDDAGLKTVEETVVKPVVEGMKSLGHPYKGILYCGLMMTPTGPKVVEFNCRFGDPECQVIIPKMGSDLVELMLLATEGRLNEYEYKANPGYFCCVVEASKGYPGSYTKGFPIYGLADVAEPAIVFHAGTKTGESGDEIVTSGGRVLGVVGTGESLEAAISSAYENVNKVSFDGAYFRKDIGHRGLRYFN